MKIALEDVVQFNLPVDSYVYLIIEANGIQEEVRFDGGRIVDGELAITRYRDTQNFPAGASVCVSITCRYLDDFVCQKVQECTVQQPLIDTTLLGRNNTWVGSNQFNGAVAFKDAVWDTSLVAGDNLLQLDKGLWIGYSTAIDKSQYGFLASVKRTSGGASLYGAKFTARADVGATGTIIGSVSEAWTAPGALAPLYGATASVYSQDSNNPNEKIGYMSYFRDRPDNVSATPAGIGANKYNQRSTAFAIVSQPRSSAGEFCGWLRGIHFGAGSLDETGITKAIGIDFSDIADTDIPRVKALIQLRSKLGVEWNGNSIDALNSSYNDTTGMWGFTWKGQSRFGFRVDNGGLVFNDTSATTALLVTTAGAASGQYLPIEVNGTIYKIQLMVNV
jgi:hypothetical protein